jgi:hypothetical protein
MRSNDDARLNYLRASASPDACRHIDGKPGVADYVRCDAHTEPGSAFCAEHHADAEEID